MFLENTHKKEEFIQKIKAIYPENFEDVIAAHLIEKPKSFRINTLKSSFGEVKGILENEAIEFKKCEFENAYICTKVPEDFKLSQSRAYVEKMIYIQELSSMLPILMLDPQKNEKILDLCASPGSKSSMIAALVNNEAEIYAIEKNRTRFFKMQQILEDYGCSSVKSILEDGNRLVFNKLEFEGYFDKVTVDAPCSNEAAIDLRNDMGLKFWSSKEAKKISKLQKGLLNSGLKMLKKGGTLIYSTCTYSVEENESVVDWALRRWPDLELEEVNLPIKNVSEGRVEWKGRMLNERLRKTRRILPNENYTGFFIAKLRKN